MESRTSHGRRFEPSAMVPALEPLHAMSALMSSMSVTRCISAGQAPQLRALSMQSSACVHLSGGHDGLGIIGDCRSHCYTIGAIDARDKRHQEPSISLQAKNVNGLSLKEQTKNNAHHLFCPVRRSRSRDSSGLSLTQLVNCTS